MNPIYCFTYASSTHYTGYMIIFFLSYCTRNLAHNAVNTHSQSLMHRKCTCTRPVRQMPFGVTTLKIAQIFDDFVHECTQIYHATSSVNVFTSVTTYKTIVIVYAASIQRPPDTITNELWKRDSKMREGQACEKHHTILQS